MDTRHNDAGTNRVNQLAMRLIAELQRTQSVDHSWNPPTLSQLGKSTDEDAPESLILQATRRRCFRERAILARSNDLGAPVALMDDMPRLAKSDRTLHFALSYCSRNKCKAHTIAELTAALTGRAGGEFRKQFRSHLKQLLSSDQLPNDVGWIVATGGRQRLFRLEDLQPKLWRDSIVASQDKTNGQNTAVVRRTEPNVEQNSPKDGVPSANFAQVFESAFRDLDQAQGGYNFVSLESLRSAMPSFSRDEFDAELRKLRIARQYRLSGAENRTDVTPKQREAGISEAGSLLLYAQRINS